LVLGVTGVTAGVAAVPIAGYLTPTIGAVALLGLMVLLFTMKGFQQGYQEMHKSLVSFEVHGVNHQEMKREVEKYQDNFGVCELFSAVLAEGIREEAKEMLKSGVLVKLPPDSYEESETDGWTI